tara:strand:+ start:98 stop:412 length:315 start_codon:yes stop_codon:yes gene_type:complete
MIVVGGLIFVAAQGGAVFVTALFLAEYLGANRNLAKAGCMAVSYLAWVAFTWALFALILRPDVYLIPAMGTLTALASSFVYLIGWVALSSQRLTFDKGFEADDR